MLLKFVRVGGVARLRSNFPFVRRILIACTAWMLPMPITSRRMFFPEAGFLNISACQQLPPAFNHNFLQFQARSVRICRIYTEQSCSSPELHPRNNKGKRQQQSTYSFKMPSHNGVLFTCHIELSKVQIMFLDCCQRRTGLRKDIVAAVNEEQTEMENIVA